MMNFMTIYRHSPGIVTRKTGNEYILVPVTNNIADMNSVYTLNETGAFIWDLIDGKNTVNDIITGLVNEYETDRETASADVISFLEETRKYLIISKQ